MNEARSPPLNHTKCGRATESGQAHFGTPKGGRSREVPLNAVALQALKAHRHLRGAFVFCDAM